MNYLKWWSSTAKSSTAARASAWRRSTRTARSTEFIVPVLRLLTLGEGGEAVGESEHSVTSQRVVDSILDIACGLSSHNVFLLAQDVVN